MRHSGFSWLRLMKVIPRRAGRSHTGGRRGLHVLIEAQSRPAVPGRWPGPTLPGPPSSMEPRSPCWSHHWAAQAASRTLTACPVPRGRRFVSRRRAAHHSSPARRSASADRRHPGRVAQPAGSVLPASRERDQMMRQPGSLITSPQSGARAHDEASPWAEADARRASTLLLGVRVTAPVFHPCQCQPSVHLSGCPSPLMFGAGCPSDCSLHQNSMRYFS